MGGHQFASRPCARDGPGGAPRLDGGAAGGRPRAGRGSGDPAEGGKSGRSGGVPGGRLSSQTHHGCHRRPDAGRVHAGVAHRLRRYGAGLARPAQRRALRRRGRGEDPERRRRRRALQTRGQHPGPADPPPYRPPDRRGGVPGRPAVSRPRTRRRRADRCLLRRPGARHRGPPPPVPGRVGRRRPRPREPDRAPRHQAVERHGEHGRTGEAPRLRHRQAPGGRSGRRCPRPDPARAGGPSPRSTPPPSK